MEKPNVNDDVKTVMVGTGDGGLRPGTQVEAVTPGMTCNAILPWTYFTDLVTKCTMAAGVTAAFGVIKDFATLFGRLEQRFPFLTGNV